MLRYIASMLPLTLLTAAHLAVIPVYLVHRRQLKGVKVIKYEHDFDLYGNERFWWLVDTPNHGSTRIMLHETGKTTITTVGQQWRLHIDTHWSLSHVEAASTSRTYYYAASEKDLALADVEDFAFAGSWPGAARQ